MKALNLTTLILVIIGGLNWGFIGIADFNLVSALFGMDSAFSNFVYIIIGLSALYQVLPFAQACRTNEVHAERGLI